jgi:hypothetical protein
MALLEVASMGVPIIASSRMNIAPLLASTGVARVVDPYDTISFSRALNDNATPPPTPLQTDAFLEHFLWKVATKSLVEQVEGLLRTPR